MASTGAATAVATASAATALFDLGPQWEHVKALGSGSFGSVQLFRHVETQVRARCMRCSVPPAPSAAPKPLHLENQCAGAG
jgi:hypothetical protein